MKEIYFFESDAKVPAGAPICTSWCDTDDLVKYGAKYIATTQMGYLSTSLFEKGYRIFIYSAQGDVYEIKLGSNECTNREIQMSHNLFKLWLAGEFSANK